MTKIKEGYIGKDTDMKRQRSRDYEVETRKDLETEIYVEKTERQTFPGTTFSLRINTFLDMSQDKT